MIDLLVFDANFSNISAISWRYIGIQHIYYFLYIILAYLAQFVHSNCNLITSRECKKTTNTLSQNNFQEHL